MRAFRIGVFLGWRQIQRASVWATGLIVIIILFTFLNLVTLSGILLGIIDGAVDQVRSLAMGDINVIPLDNETRILETERFLQVLDTYPEVSAYSARYMGLVTIEANYEERRRLNQDPDVIAVNITGIDPVAEAAATDLEKHVVEGEFLDPNESGYILLGKFNVDRYAKEFGSIYDSLKDIYPGSKVLVTVGDQTREFTVKGIINTKVDLISVSVYMPELEFRRMFDRYDYNANQIVVRLAPGADEVKMKESLYASGLGDLGKIRYFEEEEPKFVTDVRNTFQKLSLIVGIVGTAVASLTIFIVIFINVLSRRRQIGILKAIGITRRTIEFSYVTQAVFYVTVGSLIGILITKLGLIPYFLEHPIDFPYADTSLRISDEGLLFRFGVLFLVALAAGFVPAWLITRQNTLDTILGRK